MQYDENAEKYGYEGEMTPLKCDKLNAYKGDVTIPVYGTIADAEVYLKEDVDAAIEELKEFAEDACLERDDNQTAIDELQAENAELKKKLEDVQASMYCDVVDANMENRRLKRALWLARAERAKAIKWHKGLACYLQKRKKWWLSRFYFMADDKMHHVWYKCWCEVERKCLEKAEEYK